MIKLRKFALIALLLQGIHILIIRSRTMIPLQILNFMMCALFVHSQLIAAEDFKRKTKHQQENAKRVDEWFKEHTKNKLANSQVDPQVKESGKSSAKDDLFNKSSKGSSLLDDDGNIPLLSEGLNIELLQKKVTILSSLTLTVRMLTC